MKVSERFVCPGCGVSRRLEEVMTDVVQSTEVLEIEGESAEEADPSGPFADIEYGDNSTDGGVIARYQCVECGWVVKGVTDPGELWVWLQSLPAQPAEAGNATHSL